jgi:hypothetical protein
MTTNQNIQRQNPHPSETEECGTLKIKGKRNERRGCRESLR